jgi:leucyl-tRNA synthetase
MQKNWIGRSEDPDPFALAPASAPKNFDKKSFDEIEVFTTRHDTLFGASFIAIAPDHPLAKSLAERDPKIAAFIEECRRHGTAQEVIDKAEKKGIDTGVHAIHPLDPKWQLPVYVANFILMDYGTGAVFGCPAHDQRDLDFARKYKLPVLPSSCPKDRSEDLRDRQRGLCRGRQARQFTLPRRHERRGRRRSRAPGSSASGAATGRWPNGACSSASATGAFHASAIGVVRSR